jgi:N-acetylglucosaminyldiphosphoundecaprenol N-acetyl-beta-D-mannosaminyltransferase
MRSGAPRFPRPDPGAPLPRTDVLGVGISAVTMELAVAEIERRIREDDQGFVTLTGVHGVMEARRSLSVRQAHDQAAMVCPDGMPMVWSCRYAGFDWVERVYGPDLMLELCARSPENGWRHFFYGGGPGVAQRLADQLPSRFPGLQVCGVHTPPFRPLDEAETAEVVDQIDSSGADLLWIGLSTPKQELWMAEMHPRLEVPVALGVGAAFDFHAGLVPQAPPWVQRSGLEWLYRLGREPRRLWRRYLTNNPAFAAAILRQRPRRAGSER